MKFLCVSIALVLAIGLTSASSVNKLLNDEWELFKKTHSKTYTEAEEEFRMKIYLENRQRIASHNSRHQSGEVSFGMAMNKYGDLVQALHSLSSLEIYLIEFILICSSVTNLLLC